MKIRKLTEVLKEFPDFEPRWKNAGENILLTHESHGSLRHICVCDDSGAPLWDQWLFHEPLTVITLIIDIHTRKIGLLDSRRPAVFSTNPDKNIDETIRANFPELNYDELGEVLIEAPRGVGNSNETSAEGAMREAEEETGCVAVHAELIGRWIPNSTYTSNRIPAYIVYVDSTQKSEKINDRDVGEKELKIRWYSKEEAAQMIMDQKIECSATLSVLAWYFAKEFLNSQRK